ncbi:MAG: zinc ribbon domain-containing protein [Promethearchaeota archaeon]
MKSEIQQEYKNVLSSFKICGFLTIFVYVLFPLAVVSLTLTGEFSTTAATWAWGLNILFYRQIYPEVSYNVLEIIVESFSFLIGFSLLIATILLLTNIYLIKDKEDLRNATSKLIDLGIIKTMLSMVLLISLIGFYIDFFAGSVTEDVMLIPIPLGSLFFLVIGIVELWQAIKLHKKQKQASPIHQESRNKFCTYCGAGLPQDNLFCVKCGKKRIDLIFETQYK